MNEQFDSDLSRALKQGAGRELQGWEFTPAMRKNVLTRIRAEGTGSAAPAESRRPVAIPRPLVWATVAAAAFMIALNVDLSGFGGASKKEAVPEFAPQAATSAPSPAPVATTDAKGPETEKATNPANVASPPPAEPRTTLKAQGASQEPAARSIAAIPLVAPNAPKLDAAPPDAAAFKAPKGAEGFATMAAVSNISVTPAGPQVLLLGSNALTALNRDGIADWQVEIPGAGFESIVAVHPDGRLAINAQSNVYVVGAGGTQAKTLTFDAPVTRVAWAPDGRLGVLHAAAEVFADSKPLFKVPAELGAQLAFGPQGTLAILEPAGNLFIYDREGKAIASRTGVDPRFLAYGPDEDTIITAAGAFGRTLGEPRWPMPFEPFGLTLAGDVVIAWNDSQVVGLRSQDGAELWRAARQGDGPGIMKVVASGDRVVVLAAMETGGALWVFHPTEGLKLTEFLANMPLDLAVTGNHVTLMLSAGAESREIP